MSLSKFFLALPNLRFQPLDRYDRIPIKESSSLFAVNRVSIANQNQFLWNSLKTTRKALGRCRAIPGAPPSPPPFDLIKWLAGVAITLLLPVVTGKWRSIIRLKNEIDTVVETAEAIVETVEKVAEGVESSRGYRRGATGGIEAKETLDKIEHVAERASRDAHLVDDFIDKVQEVEVKVDAYVESKIIVDEKSPQPSPPVAVTTTTVVVEEKSPQPPPPVTTTAVTVDEKSPQPRAEAVKTTTIIVEEKSPQPPPPVTTTDNSSQEIVCKAEEDYN